MDEALICLRDRSGGKLVRAFWNVAREQSSADRPAVTYQLEQVRFE